MFLLRVFLFLPVAAIGAEFTFGEMKLTVPDGFSVERVAASSLVERPIEVDFDELGRLYVTEASGTNDKVEKQLSEKPHRILRLVDTDGDGVFDQRTVFADGLMLPEGCLWMNGSLFVSAPPQIWKLTDTDDDGVADQRQVWFDGKTLTGCANDLHGPYRGPDGWIYWCKGAFAEQTHTLADGRELKTRASHVFRRRPAGGPIESVIAGGMDNPVGLAWTRAGEMILSCTFFQNPAGGQRDGLIHAIYGSVYGKQHNVLDGHPRTGPELNSVMTHLGAAAPCGLIRADSDALGYRDQLFTCCFNLHKVVRHELIPSGGTFTTKDHDLIVSDSPDFHPTDVIEDKDGSLLIIDTGGWYKLCCPTSQLHKPEVHGAIYRVRKTGMPRIAPRDLAEDSAEKRLSEVWTLTAAEGNPVREAVRSALRDADETVQHAALHSVSIWRDQAALTTVAELLRSPSAQIRRIAAEALGRMDDEAAVAPLLDAIARESDATVQHSVTHALMELRRPELLMKALADGTPQVQRVALIALSQAPDAKGGPVLDRVLSIDASLADTAAWLASLRPAWRSEAARRVLAHWVRADSEAAKISAGGRRLLEGATLSSEAVGALVGEVGVDSPKAGPLLDLLAVAKVEQLPNSLIVLLQSAFETTGGSSEMRPKALAFVVKHGAVISNETRTKWLRAVANNAAERDALRITALRALPPATPLAAGEFDYLCGMLSQRVKPADRPAAAQALAQSALTPPQLAFLLEVIPALTANELSALLPAYAGAADRELGQRLVSALGNAPGFAGVPAEVIDRALKKMPEEIRKGAREAHPRPTVSTAEQKARMEELAARLPRGDIHRGHTLFNSARTACTTCHAMGYLGGTLGPDLTRIGQIRTERDLLEAIVYPSASFVRSYEPMRVKTATAEMLAIVKGDGAEEMVLAVAPGLDMRVPRKEILSVEPATMSLMPQGYDGILTAEELADMVAFLKSLR